MAITTKENQKLYIYFLKIIAIYMVLFNHTGNAGFVLFTVAHDSKSYAFYLFNAILIKIAVPLFFMTSGALLLGKDESLKHLLQKRFLKYVVILFVGSAISYLYSSLRQHSAPLSITYFFKTLYTSRLANAYWYLYTYLAYILTLPLLRRLARAMTNKEYWWMIVLHGLINSLSIIEFLIWKGSASHNGSFSLFITTNYIFYPLTGYFIDQRLRKEQFTKKNFLLLLALSFVAIAICCVMTQYRCTLIDEWQESSCQTFFNTLIFIPTLTVYYGANMYFFKYRPHPWIAQAIFVVGQTTFGIYLFEDIWRNETQFVFTFLKPIIHTLPACWIWLVTACFLGGIVTMGFKKGFNALKSIG